MTIIDVASYAAGRWVGPGPDARPIDSAVTGIPIARAGGAALDFGAMIAFARTKGGPALRALGFHDRARMLKALAMYLDARKDVLYELSFATGATQKDHLFDIDGGIGTTFVFASKGRRELPDGQVYRDGDIEQLSRGGGFLGQHIAVPMEGVAIHINAFNFPVWGMLEKLAPTILAGMPLIVKPATATCYVTEACVRMIIESGILPEGAVQMIAGGTGDLLDRLDYQDVVSFTGSARTALALRSRPAILANAVRFIAEQDSLNASILGADVTRDAPEFGLFVDEVVRELTTKAGQKCTAIRRIIAPEALIPDLGAALTERLTAVRIGDPKDPETEMGALVSAAQKADVLKVVAGLRAEARELTPARDGLDPAGAFVAPMLLHCSDPDGAARVHDTEAFGPVATMMGYRDTAHAIALTNRGGGSLVASFISHDPALARQVALGIAPHHGRVYINDRNAAPESTGHGAPLPHMIHGGPGRAGGGEEMGGIRGVMHYMQRTAIQGSPDMIAAIAETWMPGAKETSAPAHPFTRSFTALRLGETIRTGAREVTLADIETFAHFTGDLFYGHMDDAAAAANPFFPGRVAHGYLLLSFAAGLFVEPDPGPVLANTGLEDLRFLEPVSPGDSIHVRLTVLRKTRRTDSYGEVRWHVTIFNQDGAEVAVYTLLTMNAY